MSNAEINTKSYKAIILKCLSQEQLHCLSFCARAAGVVATVSIVVAIAAAVVYVAVATVVATVVVSTVVATIIDVVT